MKKTWPIAAAILILIVGGMVYLLATPAAKDAKDTMQTSSPEPEAASEDMENTVISEPSKEPGKYVPYKEDSIASDPGTTKLLFFHAPWCPQCRDLEADILNDGVPMGVAIFKVDYDSNQTLRKKYGVTLQTTFVRVDEQGNLVKKYTAYDEPTLDSVKQNLL